jgi:IS5 family transposase
MMHSKPDGFIYGYDAGAVVDEAHQVILATELTTSTTDTRSLPDLVDQVETNIGRRPRRLLADAGYQSDENPRYLADKQIDAYVAVRRDRHSTTPAPAPRGRIPADLSRRERMARKLRTMKGRAHYARRKVIVEAVFGQIKEATGFRRFSLRGKDKVSAEWHLVCAAHDLAKLFRSGRAGRVIGGWDRAAGHNALGWA